jgi:class 3 adenylate cyclase
MCSVLFRDVVGFTPLSEARDPEAVRELLSQYFAVARTVLAALDTDAVETAINEASDVAAGLLCQPLLDRTAGPSRAEPRTRAPMVMAPGPGESAAVRDG